MKMLAACEFSGRVRDAFAAKGWDAWSCDLLPTESDDKTHHIQGDVLQLLSGELYWDLVIAFPPCTHLASSGARWFKDKQKEQQDAIRFVEALWEAPVERFALENPIGVIPRLSSLGKWTQIIQPWWFGEDASKATCLWLRGLPPLVATNPLRRARYANQTPSGQNKLGPSPTRARERGRTYLGVARAMAEQWGSNA